jgi:hypothetical protein
VVAEPLTVAEPVTVVEHVTVAELVTVAEPVTAAELVTVELSLCLNGPNPGAEPYVPDPGFNPIFMPPLPPPDNFVLDDIIGNPTTLGAVVYSADPALPDDSALAPVGPMSMVYIVVLTVFEEDTTLGHTTSHGQYLDPNLATEAAGLATQSNYIHHSGEDEH